MAGLRVIPFSDEHLDAAGELLAARQRRHRQAEPLLPRRYEDPAEARAEVEALWRADDTPGAVATRNGRVVAYLIGMRKRDDLWGANVWVEPAGHAAEDAEDLRDVYASAATRWVETGRSGHYVVAPATDAELVDAWFRLGFGQQHALGVRELPDDASFAPGTREAEPDDLDDLIRLDPLIAEHQALSPVFAARRPEEDVDALRDELLDDLKAPTVGCLVAEQDGRIVGSFCVYPVEVSSIHAGVARPDAVSFLGWAATAREVRGSGAGLALTHASFAWARGQGYEVMVTDWRVTNLLSSRFWPRRGFRPTFLRLYRSIP
jgi:predicted N-acetyltransferase YhbS